MRGDVVSLYLFHNKCASLTIRTLKKDRRQTEEKLTLKCRYFKVCGNLGTLKSDETGYYFLRVSVVVGDVSLFFLTSWLFGSVLFVYCIFLVRRVTE